MDNKEIQVPEWWAHYKELNPSDKDEYNPRAHCCSRFWKDFCTCMKEDQKTRKRYNKK